MSKERPSLDILRRAAVGKSPESSCREQDYGTGKQHKRRHQRDQCFTVSNATFKAPSFLRVPMPLGRKCKCHGMAHCAAAQ